ncbi:MAG: retropepsin-like aspartic protease [Nanoarchaeota archaeon]
MNFKYKVNKRPYGDGNKSPSIPISLKGDGNNFFQFIGLLDSGADYSVIPQDVAELLGLRLEGNKEQVRGIGGWVDSVNETIIVNISKGHENYNFNLLVKVILGTAEEIGEIPIILGRDGFFDKFKITFDQMNEKVILKWNNQGSLKY